MRVWVASCVAAGLSVNPALAAQASGTAEAAFNALDTLWVLVAAILVFFMQAGFAMLETGIVRAKNAANVLTKNLLDFCFASIGFFIFGYAIMFGGEGLIVGTSGWFLAGATSAVDGVPVEAFWLFQAVFAGTAATIVSGAVAERMRFVAYLAYSFLITSFIYPVVGHWIWGGGWLAQQNFHDFAGSLTVHAVGGMAALVGAWMLGPRFGRFNSDGSPNAIGGHNLPLMSLGVFILWFGWYGFNAGSSLGFSDPELVARIALTTTLAAAMGSLTAMLTAWGRLGEARLNTGAEWCPGGPGGDHRSLCRCQTRSIALYRCGRRSSGGFRGGLAGSAPD